ncbi:MAG: PIN domain-containing protein [Hyphomonadaceae bacterium]|nr:PIN domain-containing protein [Hyphomonadaceae bacterium]
MILLDTNVLSAVIQQPSDRTISGWLNRRFPECAVSSVTTFELWHGVTRLAGKRRQSLESSIERVVRRFGQRVFPFDEAAALAAARLSEAARSLGRPLHQVPEKLADLQIAGIASAYGLDLATRNVGDFAGLGLNLIDPWSPEA